MKNTIKSHRCFNEKDYEKLQSKGYEDSEIIQIWNKDLKQRVFSDLLWLETQNPKAVKNIFLEFQKLKNNNPFNS